MRRIILACALAGVLGVPAFGQGVDPLLGTWKANTEKSIAVGFEPDKGSTLIYTRDGQNIINNYEIIDAKNQVIKGVNNHIYDGKPHASTGSPDVDATTYTRMGNTISWVRLKNGKPVVVGQGVIDGNTYTVIQGGINASNQPIYSVTVYDRQ